MRSTPNSLPAALAEILQEAKSRYLAGAHQEALEVNERLLAAATAEGHRLGQLLGWRFSGLCLYRLGRLEDSEIYLGQARALALASAEHEQELLICNHLAATVRSRGRLQEALELLEDGVRRARLPELLHAHARLLGNLGALLDELGQRGRADEYYAKFEVLCEYLGNEHRLANARGLAARSAELRKDYKTAEWKYGEEFRLAARSGDPLRMIAATIHRARMLEHLEQPDEAEKYFRRALHLARQQAYEKRLADALEHYAGFLRKRGELARAYYYLKQAEPLCRQEPEHRANILHGLSLVCRDARLFGESLWYLMRSVEARDAIYRPLKQSVRELAQGRLTELMDYTRELVEDAFRVARADDELRDLERLVETVAGAGEWRRYTSELIARRGDPIHDHSRKLRDAVESTWKGLLGGDRTPETGGFDPSIVALIHRADLSYSSTIDDLGRGVHLLALVIERELKRRVFDPALRTFSAGKRPGTESTTHNEFSVHREKRRPWSLKEMLNVLAEVADPDKRAPPENFLNRLRADLEHCMDAVRRIAALGGEIKACDGKPLRLVELRNAVAHGDQALDLRRVHVDAIKRELALAIPSEEAPTTLCALMDLIHPAAATRS